MSDEVAVVSGRVTVDGRAVLEAKDIMCALIDAGDARGPGRHRSGCRRCYRARRRA